MNSVKSEAASLQLLLSAFSDGAIESKLIANLDVQSVNTFGLKFSNPATYVSNVLIPGISRVLDAMMAVLVVEESQNPGKPLLSVQNLRVVYTAIELTWQWGVLPTISKLSGFVPPVPPYPNSLLVQKRTIDFVQPDPTASAGTLERLISTIANIVCNDTFSGLMLQRNLDRILLTYLVLSNPEKVRVLISGEPDEVAAVHIASRAASSLQRLYTGAFASMVVSKLRSFTKGPVWLRDASCEILSGILQGQRGVETVLSGYLEGSLDSSYAAALQAHVAKLVTTPPASGDKGAYLQNIAEQVRDLLLYGLFKNDKTLMRVCVLMVMRLAIVSPQLCHTELIQPLAAPLLAVFACSADDDASEADVPIRTAFVFEKYLHGGGNVGGTSGSKEVIKVRDPAVLSDALSLQSSVELLHLLVTLCPMHAALARVLCQLDVDTAMLHLYSHLLSARSAASPQLFETVESFLVNLYKFGGSKMVSRAEHFLFDRLSRPAWVFHVTKQGLVEVRMAPEPAASVSSLSQVLLAVKGDDGENVKEKKVNTDVEVALQTVKSRFVAVTSLLTIFEESIAARAAQMDVTGPIADSTTPSSSSSSAASGKKASTTSGSSEGQSGGWEYLGSELFLRSLAGFLRLPMRTVHVEGSSSSGAAGKRGSDVDGQESEKKSVTQSPDAALCGVVVLELQDKLPFVALLRDGLQILRLLKAFVEHYAWELAVSPADQVEESLLEVVKPVENISVLPGPVAPVPPRRRPLIEEISPLEVPPAPAASKRERESTSADPELITSVLGLIAAILSMGHDRRPDAEEALIRSLLEPLQAIAFRAPRSEEVRVVAEGKEEDTSVAQTASDVALMILSRSYQQSHPEVASSSSMWDTPSSAETFAQMLARMRSPLFLFSESPAMRGYATRIILQNTQRRSGVGEKFAAEDVSAALSALLPQLSDQESFVYLNALSAIRQLSEVSPKVVFDALLKIFAGEEQGQVVSTASIPTLPEARRAMVGEALVMLLHRAESLRTARPAFRMQVVELLPTLVSVCLAMARQRASSVGAASIESVVNLQTMRITAAVQDDTTNPADSLLLTDESHNATQEGIVTSRPPVPRAQLEQAIAAADADILRQSAVSLLAEALALAGAASYRYLDDVLDLALGILSVEQGHGESARAARRAAAYLSSRAITLLCESIGVDDVLLGRKSRTYDSFQSTYETLQRCALHDTDEVVKFHASRGLFELQDMYAELFSVREDSSAEAQVLEKFRIVR